MNAATYLAMEYGAQDKHEHWNGETFLVASAGFVHNQIVANVARALGNLAMDGIVLPGMRVHVSLAMGYVYPDVIVVCGRPEFVGDDQATVSNPRVIVEVRVVGEKVDARATVATVELFFEGRRVASHRRSDSRWGTPVTLEAHRPKNHPNMEAGHLSDGSAGPRRSGQTPRRSHPGSWTRRGSTMRLLAALRLANRWTGPGGG